MQGNYRERPNNKSRPQKNLLNPKEVPLKRKIQKKKVQNGKQTKATGAKKEKWNPPNLLEGNQRKEREETFQRSEKKPPG